ncbi:SDR family oxidoreductase [Parvularcula sp. BGMRC 0090]|uniref:SDR family oxidoreductase n=1 Tax=Parvularcula maris TaxID=2965077 RepID=A0A9X2RJ31_9PROT|nr:SDR family oxidoreductase [Parvularcula maris]
MLVTGSAGLLGGEICGLLAERGFEVAGLVNRNTEVARNDGSAVQGIELVQGDITKGRLGVDEAAYGALADRLDLIVHSAALTAFTEESPEHRAVNIDGTRNIIALADAGGAGLLHISTAYIAGDREGVIREGELDEGQGFTNGYESTKFEAEKLVREANVPFAIARPAIVLGDYAEGRTRGFETIYPILKVFAEGRVSTMPALPSATLDLVPIDYVCEGIAEMADRFEEAKGQTFHLVSSRPTPLRAFPETLAQFDGLSSPDFVSPESFSMEALPPAERRFFERGAAVYARYFSRNPQFDDAGWRVFSGRSCPPTDEEWWQRLVEYALAARFIRPPKKRSAA